ncbi:MAG TPA: RNA-binding protein [Puia sp.]|nr:RNA-binding protein [Puia sp.]
MNIYVSNLSFHTTEEDLTSMFSQHGEVSSAKIITDRETGRSRGFGFVEMSSDEEGKTAIAALNNKEIEGRAISVTVARPREERSGGGGSRGGYGGGGNRGGGYGGGGGKRW